MLDSYSDVSSGSSRLDKIASLDNVNRAYWEMLEFPSKTVVLADQVSLADYHELKEGYIRQLSSLKLEFMPSKDDPEWGSIIVRASKTKVHAAAAKIFCRIFVEILSHLQDKYVLEYIPETSVGDHKHSREPDSHFLLTFENIPDRIIAVFESAYSEAAKITEQEFEENLKWYFENDNDVNLAVGVYVTYVPPSRDMPDQLPMRLIVLHRNDSIDPQRISFGQDANHDQAIEFTIDCLSLFGNAYQLAPDFPPFIMIDIRYLMPKIMYEIYALREKRKHSLEESSSSEDDDEKIKASQKKKKPSKKRKSSKVVDDHFRDKKFDRKPDPGDGGGRRVLRSSSRISVK